MQSQTAKVPEWGRILPVEVNAPIEKHRQPGGAADAFQKVMRHGPLVVVRHNPFDSGEDRSSITRPCLRVVFLPSWNLIAVDGPEEGNA